MKMHVLKTDSESFNAITSNRKRADFRRDDRGFTERDLLLLEEWDPRTNRHLNRSILAIVGHVARFNSYGIPEGFAMLSIATIGKPGNEEGEDDELSTPRRRQDFADRFNAMPDREKEFKVAMLLMVDMRKVR